MLEVEELAPNVHRVTVMGAFQYADAEKFIAFAKERITSEKGGNVLFDLTSMADFTFSAVSDQMMHIPSLLKFVYSLDRIAIISDEGWLRSAARLESVLLPGVDYQVYADDAAAAALAWVSEEVDDPHLDAFSEMDVGDPSIAAFQLAGRLDTAESERGIAMVEARLKDPDCSSLMMVIKSWHGFEAELLFEFGLMRSKMSLIDEIDRYASVGGPDWLRGTAQMMGALIKPEIRAFELEDLDEAVAWLSP